MNIEHIIDAYKNDGFIYCITGTFIEIDNIMYKTCKIGKIQMKHTYDKTLSSLLCRYSTYIPDCKIHKFVRVSNCHKAEKRLFEMLEVIHHKKEHFYLDIDIIDESFDKVEMCYQNIDTIAKNLDIISMSSVNRQIREKQLNK